MDEKIRDFVRNLGKEKKETVYICGYCRNPIENTMPICAFYEYPKMGMVCHNCYRLLNYVYAIEKTLGEGIEKNSEGGVYNTF